MRVLQALDFYSPGARATPGSSAGGDVYLPDTRPGHEGEQAPTNWEWITNGRFKVTVDDLRVLIRAVSDTVSPDIKQLGAFNPDDTQHLVKS